MKEKVDNIDSSLRNTKPLTPKQRIAKQKKFLKAYGHIGVIKYACGVAGISRQTFYNWRDNDLEFQKLLPEVKDDATDTLETEAHLQAFGIEEPLVSMGQLVYEYEPDLDEKGKQRYDDKGKPLMKRGKMVTVRKFSPALLQTLLKANLPHKYKEKVEHTGLNDGPIKINYSKLSDEELALLETMAKKAQEDERKSTS